MPQVRGRGSPLHFSQRQSSAAVFNTHVQGFPGAHDHHQSKGKEREGVCGKFLRARLGSSTDHFYSHANDWTSVQATPNSKGRAECPGAVDLIRS